MRDSRFNLSALAVREKSVTLFLILLITLAGIIAFFNGSATRSCICWAVAPGQAVP